MDTENNNINREQTDVNQYVEWNNYLNAMGQYTFPNATEQGDLGQQRRIGFGHGFHGGFGHYGRPFYGGGFIGPFAGGLLGGLAAGALYGGFGGYGGYGYPPYYGGYGYPYYGGYPYYY